MSGEGCDIKDRGKSCCSAPVQEKKIDLKEHWDRAYLNSSGDGLGWYEAFPEETICLVEKCDLSPDSIILNVGAGTTTLIGFLLLMGYQNVIATDISKVSLDNLKLHLGDEEEKVKLIVDDLTRPTLLKQIDPVDLWIDRAVLHFFTEPQSRETYFNLVRGKVSKGGYAIFAEYNLDGAVKCAGLPVHRYSAEMLNESLGPDFELIGSFDYL
jgi:SAM-dependent methyltransferase